MVSNEARFTEAGLVPTGLGYGAEPCTPARWARTLAVKFEIPLFGIV